MLSYFFIKKINTKHIALMTVSYLLAAGVFLGYMSEKNMITESFCGKEAVYYGKITDIKDHAADKSTYLLKGEFENGYRADISLYTGSIDAEYGDYLKVKAEFEDFENSYLFSSKAYYNGKNIILQSDNITSCEITKNNSLSVRLIKKIQNYKEYVSKRIIIKTGSEYGGILNAMMFGDKDNLSGETKTAFYRTGIGHVMAVSGLHLVFLISIFSFLLKKIKAPRFAEFILSVIITVLFAACVNFPVSVIRAGIMMIALKGSAIFFRQTDSLNTIGICAFIMSVFCPWFMSDSSFLLSVSGTFGISVAAPYFSSMIKDKGIFTKCIKSFVSMLCVSITVFPVSAIYFDETSLLSPVSNVILIPLCMVIMFLGFALFFSGAEGFISDVIFIIEKPLLHFIKYISEKTASFDFSHISLGNDYIQIILFFCSFAVILSVIFFSDKKIPLFTVMLSVLALSAGIYKDKTEYRNVLRIAFLGNKNDTAIAAVYNNNTEIIDLTGGYNNSSYVNKYLQQNEINDISSLILTKKCASACASYNKSLIYNNVMSVIMPQSCEKWNNNKILGKEPVYNKGDLSFYYDDLETNLTIAESGYTAVTFNIYNTTVSVCRPKDISGSSDLTVFYGRYSLPNEKCESSIHIGEKPDLKQAVKNSPLFSTDPHNQLLNLYEYYYPDNTFENNTEILIYPEGRIEIRSLM